MDHCKSHLGVMERLTKLDEMEKNTAVNINRISLSMEKLEKELKSLQKEFTDFKVEMAKMPLKLIITSSTLVSILTGIIIYFLR